MSHFENNSKQEQAMQMNPTQDYAATYAAGEDKTRLASAAKYFGLANSRTPQKQIRQPLDPEQDPESSSTARNSSSFAKFGSMVWSNVGLLFSDSTLEVARMHSIGVLQKNERIANDGSVHLLTVSKRKKGKIQPTTPEDLMALFHPKPLEPKVCEVRETEDDPEYEELVIDSVEGGTITAAVFGIIKGMVGPAVLYLPRGFAMSGYGVAIPAMIVATASYIYCGTRLLQCWKVESEKNHRLAEKMDEIRQLLDDASGGYRDGGNGGGAGTKSLYGAIEIENGKRGQKEPTPTLLTYPELAKRAFGKYSFLISGGIAAMQFGVCLTYLIFVPQNLSEATGAMFGIYLPKQVFLIAMLVLEIPLSWIRDIRKLTPINILATLFIVFGLSSVLYIALFGDNDDVDYYTGTYERHISEKFSSLYEEIIQLPAINDHWNLFIGTSFFCFEGSITLLVPLQEAVYKREDRERFPVVNNKVISYIVIFYMLFAMICWASFGDSVQTALTASLPAGTLTTLVQFAYSIAVIFTFPLQAFPALEVVTRKHDHDKVGSSNTWADSFSLKRNATASVIICFLGLLAVMAIDYLGNVVSLLGSLVGIPIALIYPPLMHNVLVGDSSKSTRIMNYCLSGIGFLAAVAASYTTIVSWSDGAQG